MLNKYQEGLFKTYNLENINLTNCLKEFIKNYNITNGIKVRLLLKSINNNRTPRVTTLIPIKDNPLIKEAIKEIARERAIKENRSITFAEIEKEVLN